MSTRQKVRACCLGPASSFTHQAATLAFPLAHWDIRFAPTIDDVFRQVQDGAATAGVIPLVNSSNGIVTYTFDNLADSNDKCPDIIVTGQVDVKVQHCLLGRMSVHDVNSDHDLSDSSSSGLDLEGQSQDFLHLDKVYSHPQAIDQCKRFIGTYLKHAQVIPVSSTSKAAEIVSLDRTGKSAAICNMMAARSFGLEALARSVQDRHDNTTRFITIARSDSLGNDKFVSLRDETLSDSQYHSLYSFTLAPGSASSGLMDVLARFNSAGARLVDMNTRPSLLTPFHNTFIAEFEDEKAHAVDINRSMEILQDMTDLVQDIRWLGTWEHNPGSH